MASIENQQQKDISSFMITSRLSASTIDPHIFPKQETQNKILIQIQKYIDDHHRNPNDRDQLLLSSVDFTCGFQNWMEDPVVLQYRYSKKHFDVHRNTARPPSSLLSNCSGQLMVVPTSGSLVRRALVSHGDLGGLWPGAAWGSRHRPLCLRHLARRHCSFL